MCLSQGFAHNLSGDALDLNVHLQGSDAFSGASYFEVHITQMIFSTLNVSQDDIFVIFFDQAHGHTGDRCFNGDACIHQRQSRTANRGHRGRAIGSKHF